MGLGCSKFSVAPLFPFWSFVVVFSRVRVFSFEFYRCAETCLQTGATSPSDRWLRKAAEWNPELSARYRTNRAIGRPRKRWEDGINEFLKQEFEDTKDPIVSNNQTNKTWINIAKDRGKWALLEAYTMT